MTALEALGPQDAGQGCLAGQVVVVTGATSGIGLAAASGLAQHGAKVVLVGRDGERLKGSVAAVRANNPRAAPCEGMLADLSELDQVRALGATLAKRWPKIDVLVNNAGVAPARRIITRNGHELAVQTNHLAHFLLAHLLRERLSGGRMINTSSCAHWIGRVDPDSPDRRHRYDHLLLRYGATKRMNILFAAEAARRWPDILCVSFHPGFVRTEVSRHSRVGALFLKSFPFLRTPEQGARTLIWLATQPAGALRSGAYFVDGRPARTHPQARDAEVAARLWQASLSAVGLSPAPSLSPASASTARELQAVGDQGCRDPLRGRA